MESGGSAGKSVDSIERLQQRERQLGGVQCHHRRQSRFGQRRVDQPERCDQRAKPGRYGSRRHRTRQYRQPLHHGVLVERRQCFALRCHQPDDFRRQHWRQSRFEQRRIYRPERRDQRTRSHRHGQQRDCAEQYRQPLHHGVLVERRQCLALRCHQPDDFGRQHWRRSRFEQRRIHRPERCDQRTRVHRHGQWRDCAEQYRQPLHHGLVVERRQCFGLRCQQPDDFRRQR